MKGRHWNLSLIHISVSNSGRLSSLIMECADKYNVSVKTQVINDVDRVLEQLAGVISGDAVSYTHLVKER